MARKTVAIEPVNHQCTASTSTKPL